ncbi:nascent polypeptide-associated complex subunit alpha, muscle-specific form-like [Lagopus leucura]|uniref:nascent polypeptide-associated complex subunit alpha, muscle-specific form-like n=1 Tax=Lagopus leucura TaxID=30410 RepID=UPI001C6740B0|nr:nascent polypeptide-associated complex subunit alpha, muscle-specific form-like [Lagopus leucura]
MSREERPPLRCDSPNCPDLLRDGAGASPHSPFYRSFFEHECRAIAARLLAGSAAAPGPSPYPADIGVPRSPSAGFVTSTPLESSPLPAAGSPLGSAFLSRSRGAPRRLVLPRASGCSRLARPQPRRVGRVPPGRLPARSPGRAAGKPSLARRVSAGPEPRGAGKGPGAPATELPVPPGAKLKAIPVARSRLQHPTNGAPCTGPKASHRDKATETAGKAGGRSQLPWRLPTAIPTVASCSRLQPAGKVASSKHAYLGRASESPLQEPVCNRTRDLMENDKADQTWVCVESPYLSALHPGCGEAACAAQPAGCQLSQELEHMKKELERVKGELADKTAQCEAYCQTISSLQAQLRAAGICPEDAAEDKNSVWERN